MSETIGLRKKLASVREAMFHKFSSAIGIILLSVLAAGLEGIGLSFIVPVLSQIRPAPDGQSGRLVELFQRGYELAGLPFTLEWIIAGVSAIIVLRYTTSFLLVWLQIRLRYSYVRDIRTRAFERTLGARIGFFDDRGSEEIINAVITESQYGGRVIKRGVRILDEGLLATIYLVVAVYISPSLTLVATLLFGGVTLLVRYVIQSGYLIGQAVADVNETVHESVKSGVEGIRDVKLFGMKPETKRRFRTTVDDWARSSVMAARNQTLMNRSHQTVTGISIFLLLYVAIEFTTLSFTSLSAFLFAVFRLSPKIGTLNDLVYGLEGDLPHLVRTQEYVSNVDDALEDDSGTLPAPETIEEIEFDSVDFAYTEDEPVLQDFTITFAGGDFVAFVGSSGAGKSTAAGLLTRLYDPNDGEVRVNGSSLSEYDLDEWRERVAVVRQDPYMFNDTLYYNLTIGNRDASREEVERVCEIAQVSEFLDDLDDGYQTTLGDDGVRLSGGQRQRVAVARALLKNAELLILDEATSDMDTTLEDRVHTAIETMDRDYTMLVIAHRLSTVKNADRIYTLGDGSVTEVGPHEELIEREGQYARLYEQQSHR